MLFRSHGERAQGARLHVAGHDRDVVEEAEAHRPGGRGVVAGRAHRAEPGITLTSVEALDQVEALGIEAVVEYSNSYEVMVEPL